MSFLVLPVQLLRITFCCRAVQFIPECSALSLQGGLMQFGHDEVSALRLLACLRALNRHISDEV